MTKYDILQYNEILYNTVTAFQYLRFCWLWVLLA